MIGFGTKNNTSKNIIEEAINLGYLFIDTKDTNDSIIHLKNLSCDRNKLFIASKLVGESNHQNHDPKNIKNICIQSLKKTGLEYWDVYYIHTTYAYINIPILQTYSELLKLKKEKLCLNVGLSNITYEQLEAIILNSEKPDYVQIEIHPYLTENRLVKLCKEHNIKIVAHSPFGSSLSKEILNNELLLNLANKYDLTVAQIILNWHRLRGIIPIPSSNNMENMKSNLKLIDICDEDINIITGLNKNKRTWIKPNHYEMIGQICNPLPKRKIILDDILPDEDKYSFIINEIVLKEYHTCTTYINQELNELCEKLTTVCDNDLLESIKKNEFIETLRKLYLKNKNIISCEKRTNVPLPNLAPTITCLFHRDTQPQKCLKIIIYLSETKKENGAFQLIYPEPDINLVWYRDHRNARTTFEEIYQNIPNENIICIEGPIHTMIIFEGSILHCGGYVQKYSRTVIYMEIIDCFTQNKI